MAKSLRSLLALSVLSVVVIGTTQRGVLADDGRPYLDDVEEENHGLPEEWTTDYAAAETRAKLEKKERVVCFSAVWCGPCQYMKKNIYPVESVRKVLKENWIPVYVDVDAHRDISDKHGVRGFPTYVFLDPNGNETGRAVGGTRTPEDFLKLLETRGASQGDSGPHELPKLASVGGFEDWTTAVAFSPDGSLLAVGTYDSVELVDVKTKEKTGTLKTRSGYAQSLAFTPDGKTLIVGTYQSVELWDVEKAKRVKKLKGHRGYVNGIALHPAGDRFATSSLDATVRVWSLADYSTVMVLEDFPLLVQDVAYSPDGKYLATAGGDVDRVTKPGPVTVWNAETGELVHELVPHEKAAKSVAFSPDGQLLVSTSDDEKTNLYDVATGKARGYYNGHGRATNDALVAPESDVVISASGGRAKGGNAIHVWTASEGVLLGMVEHREPINALAISADGRVLASASNDKTVAIWDLGALFDSVAEKAAQEAETAEEAEKGEELTAGIIGLDTSHAIAFTKLLNAEDKDEALVGVRVIAAYPHGSKDIESSASRIPKYTKQMEEMGIEIVDSIPTLLEKVDVVLLETNDGRLHLEQIIPILKAKKPCFVDKPFAASLTDVVAIFDAAEKYEVPIFTSSSLRFSAGAQELRSGESEIGRVLGCDAYSPCSLEPTHSDLFWYGIHGVETLFTVMGTGCKTVVRSSTPDTDVVVGTWDDGRVGTFRGVRAGGKGYGGTAFGEKGIRQVGGYDGYQPLVEEIVAFLNGGDAPVAPEETIELHAFMEAAAESKRQGGKPVEIADVLAKAKEAAKARLAEVDPAE